MCIKKGFFFITNTRNGNYENDNNYINVAIYVAK